MGSLKGLDDLPRTNFAEALAFLDGRKQVDQPPARPNRKRSTSFILPPLPKRYEVQAALVGAMADWRQQFAERLTL